MAHGKALPAEVVEQVVAKTDGVPLFVEELTKLVLESGLLQERAEGYVLSGPLPPLAIPATLHDSLMARLDRLATVKGLAQLGATLGREFSYELLQAVSPWDEETLRRGLQQLVAAEFLYQQGLPPQATYLFKHALIQDTAYQSLLRSTRQQYHQHIAQVLEVRFPEIVETQPELVAHHYTEAGLSAPAVGYWQRAGQRAIERSANVEAIRHLMRGLEGLTTLPETPERTQHELTLHIALGVPLAATKGLGAPEVERVYTRALDLCQQVGDTPQLFPALWGLWLFYISRGPAQTAQELAARLLRLAQSVHDPALLLEAYHALWATAFNQGEVAAARAYAGQGVTLYERQQHHALAFRYGGHDPGVCCRDFGALALWMLGYPEQASQWSQDALTLAHALAHPFSLAEALGYATWLAELRREERTVCAQAEALMALAQKHGFSYWLVQGQMLWGWARAIQGLGEGIAHIRQGLGAYRATAERAQPYYLALLAEVYGTIGESAAGLGVLVEALAAVHKTGAHVWEAELYRLKGELLLQQATGSSDEAETYFRQALDVARRQQAKSWELRAAMSLARLRQEQGKRAEARDLLAPIYGWFTEGFDTADLREAKALLEALA